MNFCQLKMQSLKINGDDAASFLQGQLTADINKLENKALFCAHCNLKGRMVSLGWLFKQDDTFYYVLPTAIIDIAKAKLMRFVMRSKVKLEIEDRPLFGAWDQGGIVIDAQRSIYFEQPSGSEVPFEQWQMADIEGQFPWLDETTSGEFLPAEINLAQHGGVSLTKGCFIGQEIIARMHYLGKMKKKMIVSENLSEGKVVCSSTFEGTTKALLIV